MRRILAFILLLGVIVSAAGIIWLRSSAATPATAQADIVATLFPVGTPLTNASPTPAPTATPDAATLDRTLRTVDPAQRLVTIRRISGRDDLDVAIRAELLLAALEQEVATPTTISSAHSSFLSPSEQVKLEVVRSLGSLGSAAAPTVQQAAQESADEIHVRAVLALGFMGEPAVIPELRDLLNTSSLPDVRMTAAHLLGRLEAGDAVPDLQRALADPYTVRVRVADLGLTRTRFPVREQAASALTTLGVLLERRDNGSYQIVEQ